MSTRQETVYCKAFLLVFAYANIIHHLIILKYFVIHI
jgi:hypothetical protein